MTWYVVIFWVLAAVAIILGIAISADEYFTENNSEGGHDG